MDIEVGAGWFCSCQLTVIVTILAGQVPAGVHDHGPAATELIQRGRQCDTVA
jgi:hypothetical protein